MGEREPARASRTAIVPVVCALLLPPLIAAVSIPRAPRTQVAEYEAERPKTILELQQFRETSSIGIDDGAGRKGTATLVDLEPRINAWFLLRIAWADEREGGAYHLENPAPGIQKILLDPAFPRGLVLETKGRRSPCDLWSDAARPSLIVARKESGEVYAPLCGGRLYLRNEVVGYKTAKEWVTDLLRRYVPHGEDVVDFVRDTFFRDAWLDTSELVSHGGGAEAHAHASRAGTPGPVRVDPRRASESLTPTELGVELEKEPGDPPDSVHVGRWYPVKDVPGVFVSVLQPDLVAPEVIESEHGRVSPLDAVESTALVYLVAFDLFPYEVGFAMGTEHPGIGWSDRVREDVRDNFLPGPDGIGTVSPLVNTGMLSPPEAARAAAAFAGGFKRHHGAFRWGSLARVHHGSHYGFIENGVVMSKLEPGLATFVAYDDGTMELKTWTDRDNETLATVRYARQNGVPIVEYDETTGTSRPGAEVVDWGLGNWSGSQDKRYRTLRAGIGLEEHDGQRFLVFGYFSSATPSAMARVFQACGCRYAMHLDMNAPEHAYLAIYRGRGDRLVVEDLTRGMRSLEKTIAGHVAPRFVGYPDNRDFFFVLRRRSG